MNGGSVKAVFDTNILISGHFWKGPPYRCLLSVEADLARLVLSDPILAEFRDKLRNKFNLSTSEIDPIVERWTARAEIVRIERKSGWVPDDPDDDKFIETALAGGATVIVSGDRDLLSLGDVQGVEILTARQFLYRLAVASAE
jgi:putative PIN family toxin of toxin-antitoxin system